jgi:hypothetical protein
VKVSFKWEASSCTWTEYMQQKSARLSLNIWNCTRLYQVILLFDLTPKKTKQSELARLPLKSTVPRMPVLFVCETFCARVKVKTSQCLLPG